MEVSVSAGNDRVLVRVVDHGPGVSPAMRTRLFERFATGLTTGGTGLGLYIVRELARAHGGEARYDEAGTGAFVLDLPVLTPAADQPPTAAVPA